MELQDFSRRLSALRLKKGVSARDMSLSIGQSTSYLTNIENGLNWPSMPMFMCICDYLGITPAEFFNLDSQNPVKVKTLSAQAQTLSDSQLDLLLSMIQEFEK